MGEREPPDLSASPIEKLFDLDTPVFSREFIAIDLLPSVAFIAGVTTLLAAGAPDTTPSGEQLGRALAEFNGTSLFLLFAAALAVAVAVNPMGLRLRRVLSGVWTHPLSKPFAAYGRWRTDQRIDRANRRIRRDVTPNQAVRARWNEIYTRELPDDAFIAPTRLGNAYEALRDRLPNTTPRQIELNLSDDRVYRDAYQQALAAKLPVASLLEESRLKIAVAERYTITWLGFAVVSAWLLRNSGNWLLVSAFALAMSRVVYLGAVHAVVEHSYLIDDLFVAVTPAAADDQGESALDVVDIVDDQQAPSSDQDRPDPS